MDGIRGLVYTNNNCIGCNKCVSVCPVVEANVSIFHGEESHIEVVGDKCIHCGECLRKCKHNSREYIDDTSAFLSALRRGENISLLVSSSFYAVYGERAENILGYLKSCGVKKIYDISIGGEISIWAHTRYIYEHRNDPNRAYIANRCPSVQNLLKMNYPEHLKDLIPVHSPVVCTAIYIKKYLKDDNKLAFLSPCIAGTDEIIGMSKSDFINYNVTYARLEKMIELIDISAFSARSDATSAGIGRIFFGKGGYKELIQNFLEPDENFESIDGLSDDNLEELESFFNSKDEKPTCLELVVCKNGCAMGAGVPEEKRNYAQLVKSVNEIKKEATKTLKKDATGVENFDNFSKYMSSIQVEDFAFHIDGSRLASNEITDADLEEVFFSLRKYNAQKRSVDCGHCGYRSCKDMAKAILKGANKKENCIQYTNEELYRRFRIDKMTGMLNSAGFIEAAKDMIDANPDVQYGLCAVEINQINTINDLYGHNKGQSVICRFGTLIDKFVGRDGVAAHTGGSRFYMMIPYGNGDRFEELKQKRDYDFSSLGIAFPISFRCGVSFICGDPENLQNKLNMSIVTLERIVDGTRNTVLFYDGKLKTKIESEMAVTSHMYGAIDNREFIPYFQPQFSHDTGKLMGAEMLCRWIRKDGSMVNPGIFISVFERNGFVTTLDKYMWELAFSCVSDWLSRGIKPVPISVNVSRISINEDNFLDIIMDLKKRYDIPENLIHFEITESAYIENQNAVVEKIHDLHRLGFEVAMDDFGTGYSSLNTLKDLPFDILKIDMGFLRGENVVNGEKIIKHVVDMAKELEIDTISEGVETKEQADFLLSVGCTRIQGYFYSKPVPQLEYEKLLSTL